MANFIAAALSIDASFLVSSFMIIVAPGPGILFILGAGVAKGSRHGLAAAIGVTIGVIPHLMAATLGLTALIGDYPILFEVIRFVGGFYLIYLGFMLFLASLSSAKTLENKEFGSATRTTLAGMLVSASSPQLMIFFLSFFPSFVQPGMKESAEILGVMSLTFLLCSLIILSAIGVTASIARSSFMGSVKAQRLLGGFASLAFLLIGTDVLSGGALGSLDIVFFG